MATSKGSSFDFFSVIGRSRSNSTSNGTNSSLISPKVSRVPSFLGPSGMIENLSSLHAELDTLLGNEGGTPNINSDQDGRGVSSNEAKLLLRIRRSHWLDASNFSQCMRCSKSFGFASKKHNCRSIEDIVEVNTTGEVKLVKTPNIVKCGKVYCDSCCQYRRRLSPEGIPDPDGNIYRVCYLCADLNNQDFGAFRSLTQLFKDQRKNKRMVLSDELNRLTQGFEKNVDRYSQLKTVLSHTFSVMKVPEWQKSAKWLESSEVEWCTKCSSSFTMFNIKHHCRLCGSVFCGLCCKSNLLLYFDADGHGIAKIIGVVGCPDKEPSVCLYMPVCILCQEDVEEYQVQQYHLSEAKKDSPKGNLKEVGDVLDRLRAIEEKIDKFVPKFQEKVESYIFEENNSATAGEKEIESFAKLQGDISDFFTEYAVVIQGLKKFEMSTKTELKIMKNIISIKCKHYNISLSQYKTLKYNLDKSLPAEVLERKQNYANMNAINITCLTLRQLGFEALRLASKFNFDTLLAEKVSVVDQVCFEDLKNFVESSNEDWEKHLDAFNLLLKEQYKRKPLVLPNSQLAVKEGRKYVRSYLIERSCAILCQLVHALKDKSSENKFISSKNGLQGLLKIVTETNRQQEAYRSANN